MPTSQLTGQLINQPDGQSLRSAQPLIQLAELRGRPVVLAFYPADFSPVCGDQMALYNQVLPEFRRRGAELLGISVDGVSLTVNEVVDGAAGGTAFGVNVIPHTWTVTTLGQLKPGDAVHIEIDMLARYVARLAETT